LTIGPALSRQYFPITVDLFPSPARESTDKVYHLGKESETKIGHSLEFDFVVPPPHSWVGR